MDFRKNKVVYRVLKSIQEAEMHGGMILNFGSSADTSPEIRQFTKWYLTQTRQEKYRVRKIFAQLKGHNFINLTKDTEGKTRVTLTSLGKKALLHKNISTITIPPMKKWDKKWRLIFFSIPENLKSTRNYLRSIFKKIGLSPIQDGVWVHPFDCQAEIELISETLDIKNHITFTLVITIDNEEVLKKKFGSLLG